MTKRLVRELIANATELGAVNARVVHTSRHPRLIFRVDDRVVALIVPGSPSDHRSLDNLRADIRRALRRLP